MRRLLVANRGEIALRIFRACRAEGVETVEVAAELLRIGCWRAQGHLLGPAVPPAALRPLLEAGRVPAGVLPQHPS